MVTTLIVTHGKMAQELLDAAQMIVGEMPRFVAVSLDWDDSVEEVTEKTRRALETVDPIQVKSKASICRAGEGQPANGTLKRVPQTAEAKDDGDD
jgi:hypothetical protein